MDKLFDNLYILKDYKPAGDSPVIVQLGALIKDNIENKLIVLLDFKNISEKTITRLDISLIAYNDFGSSLGDPIWYSYDDISCEPNENFGKKEAIHIPDPSSVRIDVRVVSVAFSDESIMPEEYEAHDLLSEGDTRVQLGEKVDEPADGIVETTVEDASDNITPPGKSESRIKIDKTIVAILAVVAVVIVALCIWKFTSKEDDIVAENPTESYEDAFAALENPLETSQVQYGENSYYEDTDQEVPMESVMEEIPEMGEVMDYEPNIMRATLGESVETDKFRMTIDSMKILDEYSFSTGEHFSESLFVEEGYKLLAVFGVMENTGTQVIMDDSFYKKAIINGEYEMEGLDVKLKFERSTSRELDPYTEMNYILYANIPERLAEQFSTATFTLGFNDDMSYVITEYSVDGANVKADNWFEISNETEGGSYALTPEPDFSETFENVKIGQFLTVGFADLTMDSVSIDTTVFPRDTTGVYQYYPEVPGKKYVQLIGTLKNNSGSMIEVENMMVKVIFDDTYEYDGYVVADKGRFEAFDYQVDPLESADIHLMAEIPNEIVNSFSKCDIRFGFRQNFERVRSFEECDYRYIVN